MNMTVKKSFFVAGLCLAAFLATDVLAADMPKRKSGLWEIKVQMKGVPDMGPMLECVDKNSDNLTQQGANPDCKLPFVKRSGDKVTVYSECKISESSTISIEYILQGSFDSAYKGTVTTRNRTPQGTNASVTNLEARWLGPCKPGQKPGDVISR